MKKYTTKEMEDALDVIERNPLKGAEIVISLLKSKDDMVKLEAAIYILDRVLGEPKTMSEIGRKNSTQHNFLWPN